jgi:hypothetical protein
VTTAALPLKPSRAMRDTGHHSLVKRARKRNKDTDNFLVT